MSLNYILRAKKFKAKKSLGQNFLIDEKVIDFIASHAKNDDEVFMTPDKFGFILQEKDFDEVKQEFPELVFKTKS